MPIDPDKVHLLEPVLAWLDRDDPHDPLGFNMMYVRQNGARDYAKNQCGTVCCIAGAVAEFNSIEDACLGDVQQLLGMTPEEGDALFLGMDQAGDILISFNDVTPAIAAKTIRNFIATGEVNWS